MRNTDEKAMLAEWELDSAEDCIRSYCPKIKGLSKNNIDTAIKIAYNCCRMKLASDHNPQSIAAGAVLLMVKNNNLKIEKKDVADLFGTTDVTITKIVNKLEPIVKHSLMTKQLII